MSLPRDSEGQMRVLIVDDDMDIAKTVALTLEVTFPECVTSLVSDGNSAIKAVEKERQDLVILDVGLPDMDGFEVCRQIRKSSNVPIIMLTGKDMEEDKVAGLTSGADDYIVKPFTQLEFVARVRAVLRRSQISARDELEPVRPGSARTAYGNPEELTIRFLRSHPEGIDLSTLEKVSGSSQMNFIRLIARLIEEGKIRKEGLLLFTGEGATD
jgi:DNA-binding response OmpR family regulator